MTRSRGVISMIAPMAISTVAKMIVPIHRKRRERKNSEAIILMLMPNFFSNSS